MKIKNIKTNRGLALRYSKGFTLIETLVALVIFATSITALISVTGSGVANTNYAKNKFIASYLAQEGVEMVRNIRDNNWLFGGRTWADFVDPTNGVGHCLTNCEIDSKTLAVTSCADQKGCQLYYDYSNQGDGFYTYSGTTSSPFRRKIMVQNGIDSINQAKVTTEVSWTKGGATYTTTFSEYLFDWNK
jgi:type II secretion system protein I